MAKKEEDYFVMFETSVDYINKATNSLSDLVNNFSDVENKVNNIHKIENEADIHFHKIYEQLNKSFITPIEREDILLLANNLDDITDTIEDIAYRFLMFDIKTMRPEVAQFLDIIIRCCEQLRVLMSEFSNFKKSNVIAQKIVEINNFEEEGDRFYHETIRQLFINCKDPIEIMKWREIYAKMEDCLDKCEETANVVEGIIMKNT